MIFLKPDVTVCPECGKGMERTNVPDVLACGSCDVASYCGPWPDCSDCGHATGPRPDYTWLPANTRVCPECGGEMAADPDHYLACGKCLTVSLDVESLEKSYGKHTGANPFLPCAKGCACHSV